MKQKNFGRNLFTFLLAMIATAISYGSPAVNDSPVGSYSPEGTWVYSAPNVAEEYTTGEMIITETEDGFRVVMVLDEYFQAEARDVKYEKKLLTFSLYVESELVTVSGKFNKDEFTGTVSYSEGVFDLTATRKQQE